MKIYGWNINIEDIGLILSVFFHVPEVIIFNNHLEYSLAEKMKENSENCCLKQTKQTKLCWKHLERRDLCQIMPSDAARPRVII